MQDLDLSDKWANLGGQTDYQNPDGSQPDPCRLPNFLALPDYPNWTDGPRLDPTDPDNIIIY